MKNRFFFLPLLAIVFISGFLLRAEVVKPFDRPTIDTHEQIFNLSCIPSAVEMILKITGRAPSNFYNLQNAWKNKADGNFSDFDGKKIHGLTFHKQFGQPRDSQFPLKELFDKIHDEIKAGRYVAISLLSGDASWHIYIVYGEDKDGEFQAVSKIGKNTVEEKHVKAVVTDMKGADILTYEMCQHHAKKPGNEK